MNGRDLYFIEPIENSMEQKGVTLVAAPLIEPRLGRPKIHEPTHLCSVEHIKQRVPRPRQVLDNIPANDDIKLFLGKQVCLKVAKNILLDHLVAIELLLRNVDAGGSRGDREIEVTRRPATCLQQLNTSFTL